MRQNRVIILNACHLAFDTGSHVRHAQYDRVFKEYKFHGLRDLVPEFDDAWYDDTARAHHLMVMNEVLALKRSYYYSACWKNVGVEDTFPSGAYSALLTSEGGDAGRARLGGIALAWRAGWTDTIDWLVSDIKSFVRKMPRGVIIEPYNLDVARWYTWSGNDATDFEENGANAAGETYGELLDRFLDGASRPNGATITARLADFERRIKREALRNRSIVTGCGYLYNDSGSNVTMSADGTNPVRFAEVGALAGASWATRLQGAFDAAVALNPTMIGVYCGPARSQAYQWQESPGDTEIAWDKTLYDAWLVTSGDASDGFAISPTSSESKLSTFTTTFR